MIRDIINGQLGAALANNSALTLDYPIGTTQSDFVGSDGHKIVVAQIEYSSDSGQFTVSFGASTLTIRNRSGRAWPIGSFWQLQLKRYEETTGKLLARANGEISRAEQEITVGAGLILSGRVLSTDNGIIEADDVPGLIFDLDPSLLSGNDGTAVSSFTDATGNWTAAATGSPKLRTDRHEGPGVRFDGANDYFTVPAFFADQFRNGMTIVAVARPTGDSTIVGCDQRPKDGTGADSGYFVMFHNKADFQQFFGEAGAASGGNASVQGTPVVDIGSCDASAVRLRTMRQELEPTTSGGVFRLTGDLLIGKYGQSSSAGAFMAGDLFRLLIYNRALSAPEKVKLENMLGRNHQILNKPRLLFVGDSRYRAIASTTTTPYEIMSLLSGTNYTYDAAVLGKSGMRAAGAEGYFGALIDDCVQAGQDITILYEAGINDITDGTTGANLWAINKAFALARNKNPEVKRFGVETLADEDIDANETERAAYQTQVLAHIADLGANAFVSDVQANALIGTDGQASNTTYFDPDKLHMKNAGVAVHAQVDAAAMLVGGVGAVLSGGTRINYPLTVYGAGTAYSLTNAAAAIDFGTTDPTKVIDKAGTYLILGQVNLARNGATVVAETATIKVRRTNNTAADVSAAVVIDLPVCTTLTDTLGTFSIPPFIYTTLNANDSLSLFANVSAGLGAGTIDATAIGTSLVAIRLY